MMKMSLFHVFTMAEPFQISASDAPIFPLISTFSQAFYILNNWAIKGNGAVCWRPQL